MNGIQEVGGSTPPGSTKISNNINELMHAFSTRAFKEKVIKSYKENSAPNFQSHFRR